MNWKTAFFVSTFAFVASLFWGISKPSLDCSQCTYATSDKYQIPPDSAEVGTTLFKGFRGDLKIEKDKNRIGDGQDSVDVEVLIKQFKKLRGFKLRHFELADMLREEGANADVWAMLCVRPIPKKQRNDKDWEIDLLFQVRKKSPKEEVPAKEDDAFFDFTEPCPTACPD